MADFTSTDFISDYTELLKLVQTLTTKWAPEYSDEADPGVVLLKLAALMKDKISYKQDMAEAQAYLDTVSDRQSAFELLQMLGYVMKNKKSSTGSVQILNSSDAEIILPAFSTVFSNTDNSISFFLLPPDQTIMIGNIYNLCEVMEGSIFNIEKEGIDSYTVKDIDESGRFYLGKSGLAQNGVWIGIKSSDKSIDYTSWKNLDASALYPTEKYFFILSTSTGENYIQFPDNYAKLLGSQEFVVRATYSKGAAGNIKAGTLRIFSSSSSATNDLTFVQDLDFTSGSDEESISQGIQNYYNSQSVFNTLVTSHDFTAALRSLVTLSVSSTPTVFSNVICRSALDRQQKFVAREDDSSYMMYKAVSYPQKIEVLGLNGSVNYEESFKIYPIDDKLNSEISSQLRSSKVIGTTFTDTSAEGYIQAQAIPSGVILADISSAADAQEIQEKIISNLKTAFKAQNETFGKKINFNDYISIIQSSDSRILNVSLNDLSYQVKTFKDNSSFIEDSEKISIAAKSVIQGNIPLYKFTNRNNTLDLAVLNPGHINKGLGMSKYKQLFDGESEYVNPRIDVLQNDSKRLLSVGNGILTNLNILQFRKPVYTAEVEYGYGASVTFKHYLSEDTRITAETTLNQGSIITKGSSICLDGTASQGLVTKFSFSKVTVDGKNYWWLASLPEDYTIIESVQFAIPKSEEYISNLKKGSMITKGSTLNGKLDSGHRIEDGQEYVLKKDESIEIYTSSTSSTPSVVYGTGDIIKPSKITLECGVTYILGSIQIVSKLVESITTVNRGQKYFVVSNNPAGFNFVNNGEGFLEYTIEDNEFFVYSNLSLSEYLVLGTGTVLRIKNLDNSGSYQLDNVKSSAIKNSPDQSAFKELEKTIIAGDYEISTFSKGFKFTSSLPSNPSNPSDSTREDINIQYESLRKNEVFTVYKEDSTEDSGYKEYLKFKESDGYEVRLGILLSPDENGMISFLPPGVSAGSSSGLELCLTISGDKIKVGSTTSSYYQNLLLGQITQCFVTSSNQMFLADSSDKIQMAACTYEYTDISLKNKLELSPRSAKIKLNGDMDLTFYVPSYSANETQLPILIKCKLVNARLDSVTLSGIGSEAKIINSNSKNTFIYLKPAKSTSELNQSLTLTFVLKKESNDEGLFELSDYSIISDYSDELKYVESITGEQIQPIALDYFSPEFNLSVENNKLTGTIEDEIYRILGEEDSKKFNWLFTPSEEFSSPTNSNSYFNSSHPENYRTLPKLILDFETIQKNLKILAASGRKLK